MVPVGAADSDCVRARRLVLGVLVLRESCAGGTRGSVGRGGGGGGAGGGGGGAISGGGGGGAAWARSSSSTLCTTSGEGSADDGAPSVDMPDDDRGSVEAAAGSAARG